MVGLFEDVLCNLHSRFSFFISLAVIGRGLDESESILFGEMGVLMTVKLWPIIADALILYAVAGKVSLHGSYNGASYSALKVVVHRDKVMPAVEFE